MWLMDAKPFKAPLFPGEGGCSMHTTALGTEEPQAGSKELWRWRVGRRHESGWAAKHHSQSAVIPVPPRRLTGASSET